MLEIVDRGSCTDAHPTPLLFVHGACHAAWCWDEHFLGFFADKGYRSVALSLRGHGGSSNSKPLRNCSIADFLNDLVCVADSLPATPVVVGHSQGGFVVQKYLESHRAPAAVLLASTPPQGAAAGLARSVGSQLRMMAQQPWPSAKAVMTGRTPPAVEVTDARVRDVFFSPGTPGALVTQYMERLQAEISARALLDMMFLNLPKPQRVTTPILVLGAQRDGSVTERELHATARAYGTRAEVFPDMGHDMMLEPGWQSVAERIDSWLGGQGL
ncbi:alpha/beta hydrolase [Mycobacterium sp. OAE908]|uniref:alpha/beta hydrolase n=1 Tax=Mycobacterium sp. OAE908 TaxID=2817899 RepID=UPI001AE3BE7F